MAEGPPVRRRVVAVALLTAVVIATGIGLDRGLGTRARAVATTARSSSGALFCPHGGSAGGKGWVVLANPGPGNATVRVTSFGPGAAAPLMERVPAGREVYQSVPADHPGDASEIEYFDAPVAASAVVAGSEGGLASERCVARVSASWFLPDESTGPGETAYLVAMNPFGEPAEFDVTIRTEQRVVQPGALSPYVLPPRSSVALKVNDYLLQAPAERTVSAQVVGRSGRMIAASLVVSSKGLREEAGQGLARRWILPAGRPGVAADLILVNPGAQRADLSVLAEGSDSELVESGATGDSVAGGSVATVQVTPPGGEGLVVQSSNRRPVAAAVRVPAPGGDGMVVSGSATAARRWVVLPSLPPSGGTEMLVIQNPGSTEVRVAFRAFGTQGSVEGSSGSVTVGSGRTVEQEILVPAGTAPLFVVIEASGGVVASSVGILPDDGGLAGTPGFPPGPR